MAVSKKKVKQTKEPKGNSIGQGGNPDQYYSQHPSWNFSSCDWEEWSLYADCIKYILEVSAGSTDVISDYRWNRVPGRHGDIESY